MRSEIDQDRWLDAYLAEIDRYAALVPNRVLRSIFLGGGTPSLMAPTLVEAVLRRIRDTWTEANDLEVTLEANPGSVEATRFAKYAEAGVNRISMGIQALNNADLKRLGRLHTVEEAFDAFGVARRYFDRVSFDLIYARQDQTVDAWRSELSQALDLAVDHLSLYQLTIEPGTAFGDRAARSRLPGLPDEATAADMYEITQDLCAQAGLHAYEISNHAREDAESRHNLVYWTYGDYVGIGPGAHGRVTLNGTRHATEAWSSPERWLAMVAQGKPEKTFAPISSQIQADEYLMMGLRIREGIDLVRYAAIRGAEIPPETLSHLQDIGVVAVDGDRLRATPKGRLLLNAIIQDLLSD